MIYLKSEKDIQGIKLAAAIWKKVKAALIQATKPGVSTKELDKIAADVIYENKATPSFYKYEGFPGYICISVNEQLIHGIANEYILRKSDIITFDIGVTYKGYVCDAAFSIVLDSNNKEALDIQKATLECLEEGIKQVIPGNTIGDISYAIEQTATNHGYQLIKDFGGHGCGLHVHEDPIILNYGTPHTGVKLRQGMVLCIEPMLMIDSDEYVIDASNHWTVSSKNKKLTCHEEHMVVVTSNGCEVLTAN